MRGNFAALLLSGERAVTSYLFPPPWALQAMAIPLGGGREDKPWPPSSFPLFPLDIRWWLWSGAGGKRSHRNACLPAINWRWGGRRGTAGLWGGGGGEIEMER